MICPETAYDHLIPQVSEIRSTLRLHLLVAQVTPPEMAKLLMHVIAKAEQIGEERGKQMRSRR
jgi:hypothetical protein